MKLSDFERENRYTKEEQNFISLLNRFSKVRQTKPITALLAKRLVSFMHKGKYTQTNRVDTEWLADPEGALEQVVSMAAQAGLTADNINTFRIRRVSLSKPLGPDNILIARIGHGIFHVVPNS